MPSINHDITGVLVQHQNDTNETYHVHDQLGRSVLLVLPPGALQPGDRHAFQAARVTISIDYDDEKAIPLD